MDSLNTVNGESNNWNWNKELKLEDNLIEIETNQESQIDPEINIQNIVGEDANVGKISKMSCSNLEKVFSCGECDKSFTRAHALRRHTLIHTGEKPHTCNICGYQGIYALSGHIKTHFPGKTYSDALSAYISYKEMPNIDASRKSCFYHNCKFSTFNEMRLKVHLRTHSHKESKHKCSICDKSYACKKTLVQHQKIHTDENAFHCRQCDKLFSSKSGLTQHMIQHNGEAIFQCTYCAKRFFKKVLLVRHERIHTGEKPYQCLTCGKGFPRKDKLKEHERVHTGEKPYHCDQCKMRFNHKVNLIKHQRTHTGEKPYRCSYCDKCFSQNSTLMQHLSSIHHGELEKPCQFTLSEIGFALEDRLLKHKITHTIEKPYQCNYCDKVFSQNSTLMLHQKMHTEDKPFQCSLCEMLFSMEDHLIKHLRKHNEEIIIYEN